ncbi:hypothetical protein [Neptunomonas sp.]|uniref:hypothetical protein n=1 Tax=Neptunomonas sp. TaxID=1971898 RepID=UPI0025E9E81F|nr:hypothetical protein [Neptunomonas sp.]
MPTVLGIHSNVAGENNGFSSGHAWITVTKNSVTQAYGLWPDGHPRTVDNGPKTDIRIGLEGTRFPAASRFFKLNASQEVSLNIELKKIIGWTYTNTCASWASDVVYTVVGVDVDADDWAGFETPRELGRHIVALEKANPTTVKMPVALQHKQSSW